MPRFAVFLSILAPVLALSCGSNSESAPATAAADTGEAVDTASDDVATAADTGPAEVCGLKVGEVFCDYSFSGYISNEATGLATATMYGTHKLSEALALGTQKYVFIYFSAYW